MFKWILVLIFAVSATATPVNKHIKMHMSAEFTADEIAIAEKDFELVLSWYKEITGLDENWCHDVWVSPVDPDKIRSEYEVKGIKNVVADYLLNQIRINRADLSSPRKSGLINELTHHFNQCKNIFGEEDERLAQLVENYLRTELYEPRPPNFGMQRP